ncbi:MAG: DUF502 domain-containing protein [Calditrichia bacterium]
MKKILNHIKTFIFRGLLAVIPLGLTYFVVNFLYVTIDRRVMGFVDEFIGFSIPGLGIVLVLCILYIIGFSASNVVGRQFFNLIERTTSRIPLVRSTYQIGKQLSATLSLPEKQVFKRAVLVTYLKPGLWTVGFVTGSIFDKRNNEKLLKVFVPTPPLPTSGTMILVRENEVRDPGWTLEEAMRTVISGGIIGPNYIE